VFHRKEDVRVPSGETLTRFVLPERPDRRFPFLGTYYFPNGLCFVGVLSATVTRGTVTYLFASGSSAAHLSLNNLSISLGAIPGFSPFNNGLFSVRNTAQLLL
jgi:hypothetical protein